jgi:hypothetical protein
MTDRRSNDRLPIEVPALFVRELGDSDVWTGRVVNLSEGGACLITEEPVAVGTQLYVGLFLDGFGGLPVIAMGKVIWVNLEDSTVGLAFAQAGPAQRHSVEQLRDYLAGKRREMLSAQR